MPITIGSNIASLKAQRKLSEGTGELSRTFEKLSSGLRINKSSDDAAGLAISESLKSDKRVFTQGIRNLNDGISLLNIADSAVENLSSIVIRLKELAEQSANGTFGTQQRESLDAEAQALAKEYLRISQTTQFNGRSLLTGSTGDIRLQAGYGLDGSISSNVGGAIGSGTVAAGVSYLANAGGALGVALGDLNGDGILDMLTSGSGNISVRLGTGGGSFGTAVSYQTGHTGANAVQIGDLDGDGILDFVSVGEYGGVGRVSVSLGRGDGTFGSATTYTSADTIANNVTLGDINNDGALDLVSVGGGSGGVASIRLGNGDGTFGAASTLAAETGGTNSVVLRDLNNDGLLDLITSGTTPASGARATVRLGTGSGTFGTAVSYVTSPNVTNSITFGDLNGDGILDLVGAGGGASTGYADVMLGNGDGTFGTATTYVTESSISQSVSLGDLNGDGFLDLITSGLGAGGGQITIRLGAGDGSFGSSTSYLSGSTAAATEVALGDVSGDGVLDIVTSGYDSGTYVGSASVFTSNTKSGVAPILPFDLTTRAGALQALPVFGQKLDQLAKQRGTIGAFQSRIGVATNTLQVATENFAAAASRITDVDVAEESSRLIRLNILQQASASVLAQANLQPNLALTLLQ